MIESIEVGGCGRDSPAVKTLVLLVLLTVLGAGCVAPAQKKVVTAAEPAAVPADADPALLSQAPADYPSEYEESHVQGRVVVEFQVGVDGSVTEATVIETSDPRLSRLATAAVMKWTYRPAIKNGRPVSARLRVPFEFHPREIPESADQKAADEAFSAGMKEGRSYHPSAALTLFSKAIELSPDTARYYRMRSAAYVELGDTDHAMADATKAIHCSPNEASLYAYRSRIRSRVTWSSRRH